MADREAKKRSKFMELVADLACQWPRYTVTNVPVVIGILGFVCGVYPLCMENADYAIMLIYYGMLCLVRLSSSPSCSICLNCNPLTSCVYPSSSRYNIGMLFFRLFFICIDVNCCVVVLRDIIKEFYKSYRWAIHHKFHSSLMSESKHEASFPPPPPPSTSLYFSTSYFFSFTFWLYLFQLVYCYFLELGCPSFTSKQLDMLLLCVDDRAQQYYYEVDRPDDSMNNTLGFLRARFEVERNALAERVSLEKMVQQPGQSLVQYGSSIRKNARHSAYHAG